MRGQMFDVNDGNDDWKDLVHPEKYGLTHTQNIYFRDEAFSEGDKVGGWWIRPVPKEDEIIEEEEEKPSDKYTKQLHDVGKLGPDDTVFVLLHGNAKNRGASHRIAAYQLFQRQGYHTLTMDYRGYGDSTMSTNINETTVVEDAKMGLKFVRDQVGNEAKLLIYGHSMGTGIASRAAAECNRDNIARVDGVILDSPFHSIMHFFDSSPYMSYLTYIMDLDYFFQVNHLEFNSPKWLSTLKIPVTVFHATVDHVVPIKVAEALVKDVKKMGKEDIKMIVWEEEGLGHIGISKTPQFPERIRDFVIAVHAN